MLSLSACAATGSGADCVSRRGYCFDAAVSGLKVQPLSGESKAQLGSIRPSDATMRADLEKVEWQVQIPENTAVTVSAAPNSKGAEWFGTKLRSSLDIEPLVSSGGSWSSGDALRAGRYIGKLELAGEKNWDRKQILVEVGAPEPIREETAGADGSSRSGKVLGSLTYDDFIGQWTEMWPNVALGSNRYMRFTLWPDGRCLWEEKLADPKTKEIHYSLTVKASCRYYDGYLEYRGTDEEGKKEVNRFRISDYNAGGFKARGADNQNYDFRKESSTE